MQIYEQGEAEPLAVLLTGEQKPQLLPYLVTIFPSFTSERPPILGIYAKSLFSRRL
jgi:hypothetical protein